MMQLSSKSGLFWVIVLVLLAQALSPFPARAEGESTPTPFETGTALPPTETIPVPMTETPPVPTTTESPAALATETATSVLVEPPTGTPTLTETLFPTFTATLSETPTPLAPPVEADQPEVTSTIFWTYEPSPTLTLALETLEPTVTVVVDQPTLMEQIPAGTDLIVLGADGQPEPLASIEAVEIIANSDPVWCPGMQAPTPDANGCSSSYTTLAELVAAIGPATSQAGTIWITSGPVGDTSDVTIDGSVYTTWANYALTLQGGWSGTPGDIALGANSVFSEAIIITNWDNSLTLKNITVDSTTSSSINSVTGNVTVTDSSFKSQTAGGLLINNDGDVVIGDSFITGNVSGVTINNTGKVVITDSTIGYTNVRGAVISSGTGVNISRSRFNSNNSLALSIENRVGEINISDSDFNDNIQGSAYISNNGIVTIINSTFSSNEGDGASISNNDIRHYR